MANALTHYKIYYERRIEFLQLQVDHFCKEIYSMENKINEKEHFNQENVDLLKNTTKKVICLISEIQTCKHFNAINRPFTDIKYFNEIYQIYYNKTMQDFNKKFTDEIQTFIKAVSLVKTGI